MLVVLLRVAGFVAVMGVALRLLPRESIGLWYGMVSLAFVSSCVEFGFSATIGRAAGYFWAGAGSIPKLGLSGVQTSGEQPNVAGLRGLVVEARRIYRVLAVLYLAISFVIAAVWLSLLPPELRSARDVLAALGLLIVGGALNLTAMFWPSLLQGLQEVRLANVFLAAGFLSGYLTSLAGLWLGGGLVGLATGLVVQSMVTRWLARRHVMRWFQRQPRAEPVRTDWRMLWPMTWRSGLAQASSYLVLPVTPLLVTTFSLNDAASFGLCVQAALMLHTLAASWIAVKWPLFGFLRASGKAKMVRRIARERLVLSMLTFALCASVVPFVAPAILARIGSHTPFVTTMIWTMLAVATGIDLFVGIHAGLIQTGNRVSHLRPYILTGLVNLCGAALLTRLFGPVGALASTIACPLLVTIWWVPREAWRQLATSATEEGVTP